MNKKQNVLVVDDDRDFAESLADALRLRGHEVEVVFSGYEAIEKFAARDFDVAFIDVRMPGINGVESLREIRKTKPQARVVMMTGYTAPELLQQAVDQGAWKMMQKPLNMSAVLRSVESLRGVLIVDDDADFVDSLTEALFAQGYTASVAHDGEAAIAAVEAQPPDVLILDLRLPGMGGLETYSALREKGFDIPTVVVTGYATEESDSISRFSDMSIQNLSKPLLPQDLINVIQTLGV